MKLRWGIALLALSLGGCAVQQTGPGRVQIALDEAELFGRRLETVRLVDGSEATLRQLRRVISFKHQRSATVIPLRDAERVKVLRTEFIGDRSLIVVEKSSGGCPQNVDVFLVRGRDVSVWNFNACRLELEIERVGDEVFFDQIANNRLTRTIFRDDKLVRLKTVPLDTDAAYTRTAPGTGSESSASRTGTGLTSRMPPPPRSPRPRTGPPPIVAEGAPRALPGLPIAADQFQTAAASRPFLPEPPAAAPVAPASTAASPPVQTARAPSAERQTVARAPAEPAKRAPPPRPRGLAGEVDEVVAPVRIKLD